MPLIDNDELKKFKHLYKNKKNNKSSAIFRLFELREAKKEEFSESDNFLNNKGYSSRKTINPNYNKLNNDIILNNDQYKDDTNIITKKSIKFKVVFKGETSLILKHLFDDTLKQFKKDMRNIFKQRYYGRRYPSSCSNV